MASRALASCARTPDDYIQVYDRILTQVSQPVILHWLGDMFDPALAGYWGYQDLDAAMMTCLSIIERHAAKIDGIKISLLNADREIAMRRRLPPAVRMYTGDDFNYPELIRGDEQGYSHALLGIFDAIAPAAAAALQALDAGDVTRYMAILAPTVPLSRHIFQAPTYYYKTGVVFLAYLNGHQSHFRMVAGLESARSVVHLAELFVLQTQTRVYLIKLKPLELELTRATSYARAHRLDLLNERARVVDEWRRITVATSSVVHLAQLFVLADKAGLLKDPELATERMRRVLAVAGIV